MKIPFFQLAFNGELDLGSLLTACSIGGYARLGKFVPMSASRINQYAPGNRTFICFISLRPVIQYVEHDALLEGRPGALPGTEQDFILNTRDFTTRFRWWRDIIG